MRPNATINGGEETFTMTPVKSMSNYGHLAEGACPIARPSLGTRRLRVSLTVLVGLFLWVEFTGAQTTRSESASSPVAAGTQQHAQASTTPPPTQDDGAELERLLKLAAEHAPEVELGRATLTASGSAQVGARLMPLQNPYVEVLTEHGRGVTRDLMLYGTLWLPFEVAGQRGRRIAEADAWQALHATELERLRVMVKAATTLAYGQLVVGQAKVRLLDEITRSAEQEASALSQRRDAGDATERDAQLAEVEFGRNEVLLVQARTSVLSAMSELERLTGREVSLAGLSSIHPRLASRVPVDAAQSAAGSPLVLVPLAEARFHDRTRERLHAESYGPVSLMLIGARGDYGETRVGAGLAWTLPTFRRMQGEQARAEAEALRARTQSAVALRSARFRLNRLATESQGAESALERLDAHALPAAERARDAADAMFRAGKADLVSVLIARRDLALLRLTHLELAEHQWLLAAQWVEVTGKLP